MFREKGGAQCLEAPRRATKNRWNCDVIDVAAYVLYYTWLWNHIS